MNGIIDRGRGPEIEGSRITVYDVLAETQAGTAPEDLAREWGLSAEQIHTALKFIDDHREEVLVNFRKIKERHQRGNPPELREKLDAMEAKYAPMWEALRRKYEGDNGNGRHPGGH